MSTLKSSNDHLTLNADGTSKDIKFQADGVEKASISSAGAFTSTSIDATKLTGTVPNFTSTGIDDNATSTKLTTTSTGIDVTGSVTCDGLTTGNNQDITLGGVLVGSDSTFSINLNTADGSDTSRVRINGGGGNGSNRGAQLELQGNEHTFGGDANLTAGDSSGAILTLNAPDSSGYITLSSAGSERLRIDSSGNVGIARSGYGSVSTNGFWCDTSSRVTLSRGGGSALHVNRNSNTGGLVDFHYSGTFVGYIGTSGSSTSYNTSSDYRLKENLVPITDSITRVKALQPYRFNFIADPDVIVDGFVAHEAGAVVPECCSGEKDAMKTEEYEITPAVEEVRDDDGNITVEAVDAVMGEREVIDPQGIDQSKLVPLLTAALQDAIARIEVLEAQ